MTNMNVSLTLRLVDQFTQHGRAVGDTLNSIKQSAENLQRAFAGGSSMGRAFTSMQSQARALGQELRSLQNNFSQLGTAMNRSSGNSFAQRQISDLRQVLQLQQQVLANNQRMVTGPGGPVGPRGPGGTGGGGGFWGRSGFSPNASIQDRLQYRGVNLAERSVAEGTLDLDRVRTRFSMLGLSPETRSQAEHLAAELGSQFRELTKADILDTFSEAVTQFLSGASRASHAHHRVGRPTLQITTTSVTPSWEGVRCTVLAIVCRVSMNCSRCRLISTSRMRSSTFVVGPK